jgi:hypothetical protein
MDGRTASFKVGWWLTSGSLASLLAAGLWWLNRDVESEKRGETGGIGATAKRQEASKGQGVSGKRQRTAAGLTASAAHQPEPRYARPPAVPGQHAVAKVQARGREYQLTPNQVGNFQRMYVEPNQQMPVQVGFPEGQAGDSVAVVAEDGGKLREAASGKGQGNGDGGIGLAARLDERKEVAFTFQATKPGGLHRVTLRHGTETKTLEFWVGNETPVAQR